MLLESSELGQKYACSDSGKPTYDLLEQAGGQQACDIACTSAHSSVNKELHVKPSLTKELHMNPAAAGAEHRVRSLDEQQQAVQDVAAAVTPDHSPSSAAVSSDVQPTDECQHECASGSSSMNVENKQRSSRSSGKATVGVSGATVSGALSSKPGKTSSGGSGNMSTATAASTALAAAKLGLNDQLTAALTVTPAAAAMRDVDGRCCLHYAAAFGHEDCVETLLAKGGSNAVRVRDMNGELPLHSAAQKGQPMCAYNIAKACPASCLVKNKRGQTPIDLAAAAARGEVLNALLLACAGDGKSAVAVAAMRALLTAGAVPDTWAPNGSSALMLAAAADGVVAVEVLLDNGASIELQDALGRSALMFAAGNNAAAACKVLLDRNASLSARDRRGRAAVGYAPVGSEAAKLLQQRLEELETVANQLQQQLLQEQGPVGDKGGSSTTSTAACGASESGAGGSSSKGNSANKKKKKKKVGGKAAAAAASSHQTGVETAAADTATAQHDSADSGLDGGSDGEVGSRDSSKSDNTATQSASQEIDAEQQQQQERQLPTAADISGQPPSICGVATMLEQCPGSLLDGSQDEWQVVLPKGKQRGTTAVGHNTLPDHNSSTSAVKGTCPLAGSAKPARHAGKDHKLSRPSAAAAATSTGTGTAQQQQGAHCIGSGSGAGGLRLDGVGDHSDTCHKTAAVTAHHSRQGSSHSFCSTVSVASYDSNCSSNGNSSAAHAGQPSSSCSSRLSCCTQQSQHQQLVLKPGAVVGSWSADHAAEQHAVTAHKDNSSNGNSNSTAYAAHNGHALSSRATHLPGSSVSSSSNARDAGASRPNSSADAVAITQQPVGFKAALLGAVDDHTVAGSAASFSTTKSMGQFSPSQSPAPPAPPAATAADVPQSALSVMEDRAGTNVLTHLQGDSALVSTTGNSCEAEKQHQQQQQQDSDFKHHHQQQQQLQLAQAEIASLKQLLKQQAVSHQQQLAAVLEDAATHEAAAVSAAARAAAAETLQSPLVRQLLAAAAQQAVATERVRMQLRLQQLGVSPAAQLQLLLGPVSGTEAAFHSAVSAAALLAATATAEGAETAAGSGDAAVACSQQDVQAILAVSQQQQQQTKAAGGGRQQSPVGVTPQQQRQQDELSSALMQLQLDLRSEYYGGGSSFVAPARFSCSEAAAVAAGSTSTLTSTRTRSTAAAAAGNQTLPASIDYRRVSCEHIDLLAPQPGMVGSYGCSTSRRDSSNCGTQADSILSAAATRTSSSSSLAISVTDDAEVEDTRVGGFGAIGGPPGSQHSCSTPRSRALSCSPAAAAAGAATAADFSGNPCSPAFNTAATGPACGFGLGAFPWCDGKFPGSLLGSSLRDGMLQVGVSKPTITSLQVDCRKGSNCDVEPLEHQLVGGLLMDEDCAVEKGASGHHIARGRDVVDLLPDHL